MTIRDQINEVAAISDRMRAELAALDQAIQMLLVEDAATRRALGRYDLGEIWGATKLALHLGVSRNTAHKMMKTEMAHFAWTDAQGRLRVSASDVQKWIESTQSKRVLS